MNDAKVNKSKDPQKNIKIRKLKRRSISSAVIESAHCEHIELIECDAYDSEDMKCLISATGMPCCICTGKLRSLRKIKKWIMW
uniref:Ribosomal_L7Ae domain-containing protein n=1 Tax=Rhabditophanes sp. KR3021 TaxID=114890 RepID=A0AC35TLK7_9BILA